MKRQAPGYGQSQSSAHSTIATKVLPRVESKLTIGRLAYGSLGLERSVRVLQGGTCRRPSSHMLASNHCALPARRGRCVLRLLSPDLASPGNLNPVAGETPQAAGLSKLERSCGFSLVSGYRVRRRKLSGTDQKELYVAEPKPTPTDGSQPSCLRNRETLPTALERDRPDRRPQTRDRMLRSDASAEHASKPTRIDNGRACDEGFHYRTGRQDL